MTTEEFDLVKRQMMAQSSPARGEDLAHMIQEFRLAFERSLLFRLLWVKETGEPDRIIEAWCEPAADTVTIPEAIAQIERIWMEELCYPHLEAHIIVPADYDISLHFSTVSASGGFHLTGQIAVDIRRIQGTIRAVTFWYRLTGSGSSEAGIYDGVERAFPTASYISDALGDLARAVIALLQGAPGSTCSWEEEPGAYRWIFNRQGEDLQIEILWFEDPLSFEPQEPGKRIFLSQCRLRRFAAQLRDQLQGLLAEHGEEGYRRNWGLHDFPTYELNNLDELLALPADTPRPGNGS